MHRSWLTPALLGIVGGPALELQQPALWTWPAYAFLAIAALLSPPLSLWERAGARAPAAFLCAAILAFCTTGLRASHFQHTALTPILEGRDVAVTGIVAAMPQRSDTGLRFRFSVESAQVDGTPATLVPQLYLGWYGGVAPDGAGGAELQARVPDLRAGDRWAFTVRLKAPHGNLNPHGFDYELWLWEQGLQATGYVRAGPRDAPAQRVDTTWRHPVERARHAVRDAVYEQVPDRKTAGILAALVTGDQNAIELVKFFYSLRRQGDLLRGERSRDLYVSRFH
jgi:competence protein ComEC